MLKAEIFCIEQRQIIILGAHHIARRHDNRIFGSFLNDRNPTCPTMLDRPNCLASWLIERRLGGYALTAGVLLLTPLTLTAIPQRHSRELLLTSLSQICDLDLHFRFDWKA